ncbi:hypothetical protein HY624_01285 [Candidatus Uhrbacteria bacterium]|nr:hypothetical protein [Candidatus Uhrbacteria bacterium]
MLNKKEIIWREVLHRCFHDGILISTQKELAKKLHVSLSTVHNALKFPRASGAIVVTGRNFRVQDKEKFLLLFASHRRFQKDMLYTTHVDDGVRAVEGRMPEAAIFATYSAYRQRHRHAPADYDVVYVYVDRTHLPELQRRFPPRKGSANFFVLAADPHLAEYGGTTPDVQTFVDLWNVREWYAKDFLTALRKRLHLV